MPLFERKTEQEKAAAKAEKDRRAQIERERKDAEKAADDERRGRHEAAVAAHVEQLPKYEYRTVIISRGFFVGDGKIPTGDLDDAANRVAVDNWRLVSTSMTGKMEMGAMRGDRNDIFLFFERPAVPQGSAVHS
jgi:hypothetical protein